MFLERLSDTQKEMFLDLAVYSSRANGIIDESEKNMLIQYSKEMNIGITEDGAVHSMDEIVSCFAEADDYVKRIIIIELLGLYYADGDFDNEEKTFALVFANNIGVDRETYEVLLRDITEYLTVFQIIQEHVFNDKSY